MISIILLTTFISMPLIILNSFISMKKNFPEKK